MIYLDNIELISINCVRPELSVNALKYSSRNIKFKKIKLFADIKPKNLTDDIEFIKIPKLTHDTINQFAIKELPNYLSEDYMLSIHDDGFVINPHLYNPIFLEYDYIGAPWPEFPWCKTNRVGNGGFVLKSKKFYMLEQTLNVTNIGHNDVLVTNIYYDYFTSNGCKYAPLDIAYKFSIELPIPEYIYDLTNSFGFHGLHTEDARNYVNMIKHY